DITSLKEKIDNLETQIKDLKEAEEKLLVIESSLEELSDEAKRTSYITEEIKKKSDSLSERFNRLSRNYVSLKKFENEIREIYSQINSLKTESYKTEELKNSIVSLQKIIQKIGEDYASLSDLEQHSKKIYSRINRINGNFKRFQNQISELADNLVSREEILQIKSEIDTQLMFFEKGLKALQDDSVNKREFELKNRGILQRLNNLKENLYLLRLKTEDLLSISEKNASKLREIDLINEKLLRNETKTIKQEQNIKTLKRDLEKIKSELKISEEKNDFLERKIDLMNKEIESIKDRLLRVQSIGLKTMEIIEEKKPFFKIPKIIKAPKRFIIKKPSKRTWIIAILLFLITLVFFLFFNYPNLLTTVISKLNISINLTENITSNITENITSNMTNVTNESSLALINLTNITKKKLNLSEKELNKLNELCILKYECKEIKGKYYYECYYSINDDQCHCFIGEYSDCNNKTVEMLKEKYDIFLPIKRFFKNTYSRIISFTSTTFSKIFIFIGIYRNYFIIALVILLLIFLFLNYREEIFDFFTEVEEEETKVQKKRKK
ncbi:MAG: hypothetical protein QXU20_02785, partial [Candidatus Woesearchaeota archaeon]